MLVYNDSFVRRTPLATAVSTDGGKTLRRSLDIATGEGSFAYPYAVQTRDGEVHVVYTSDGRTTIRLATFDEQALLDAAVK